MILPHSQDMRIAENHSIFISNGKWFPIKWHTLSFSHFIIWERRFWEREKKGSISSYINKILIYLSFSSPLPPPKIFQIM